MQIYAAAAAAAAAAVQTLMEKGKETQFTTKIGGRTSLGIPVTCLMPYYAKTGHSRPLIT